jgi:DNA-binding MarR family transcriptional regulator
MAKQGNVVWLAGRIAERAHAFLVAELKRHGLKGIVPSHGDILAHLLLSGPMTMSAMALTVSRTQPTVTVLVDKLIRLGYVTKTKDKLDKRVSYLKLTAKGLALKPAFFGIAKKLNAMAYAGLSDEDAARAEQLLQQIKRNLDSKGDKK